MKIFISHSSKQKLFVKELRKYLPYHLNLWIDEREILIGSDLDETIKEGIEFECDYFLIVIDYFSIQSECVRKEIEWAIKREDELGRIFLLPIVLEIGAWNDLDISQIKKRKYLSCFDFTDACIETLAKNLSSEILGWLCSEFELRKHIIINKNEVTKKNIDLLKEAENLLNLLSTEIRKIVLPYRRSNPLSVESLYAKIRNIPSLENLRENEFTDILIKMQKNGSLKGIYYDGDKVYLQRETYTYKADLHTGLKKKIAERAFEFIEPGQIIAIDGGSTTLELTILIAKSLKLNDLYGLKIITNSLTTVTTLLETLSELNMRDFDDLCNIYLLGGRARPISFTVVPEIKNDASSTVTTLDYYIREFGGADVCFLGTNGINEKEGFAVHNSHELKAKEDMINNSKNKIILVDPSKFLVKQERIFARFDQELTIITADDGSYTEDIETFSKLIENTNSSLIIA